GQVPLHALLTKDTAPDGPTASDDNSFTAIGSSNSDAGTLFKNFNKKTERHPDCSGSGNVKCPHCNMTIYFRISAWVKDGKVGKFLSMSFSPKEQAADEASESATDWDWFTSKC